MCPDDDRDPGARLPMDSDVEVEGITAVYPPRPVHLRVRYIGVVALGGALGTGAREALSLAIPSIGAFPVGIFLVNVTGAFALGLVLAMLLRLGPDEGRRRQLRLFIGTGFLGGYTTYSTLAVGTAEAITGGQGALGILYGVLSVIAGAVAAFAGIAAVTGAHTRQSGSRGGRL